MIIRVDIKMIKVCLLFFFCSLILIFLSNVGNDNTYYDDQNQYDPYQGIKSFFNLYKTKSIIAFSIDNNYNSGGDFFNPNNDQYRDNCKCS